MTTVDVVEVETTGATIIIGPSDVEVIEVGVPGPPGPAGDIGESAVTSVNGDVGDVVLTATDVGADPTGTAAAAVSAHTAAVDPHPGYLTAAEGNAAYDATGAAAAVQANLTAHTGQTGTSVHGLGDASTKNVGTTAGTVAAGDDARLTDARTPTAHKTSHQDGGTDELALDGSQITSGTVAEARIDAAIARDSEVATAVSNHAGAADPHGDRAYAASLFATNDALLYKGAVDCSANPNYPAADAGHAYKVSVAGKIGGASGVNVEVGDLLVCTVDGSTAGTQAAVGANWDVIQVNLDGAVIGPSSATDGRVVTFDGTSGRLVKDSTAPTAPTQSANDNSTKLATTAYADTQSAAKVSDTAYDATSWDGVTSVAPSKNAVRDKFETLGNASTKNVGTTAGTVAAGDDARLSDTRTPTDNSVTSAKIVDGTIVNIDIAAAAAIALSKLAILDVNNDITLGLSPTFSAGTLHGGVLTDPSAAKLSASYTVSQNPASDSADWAIGTRLLAVQNDTLTAAANASAMTRLTMGETGVAFPRAVVQVEGTFTAGKSMNTLEPAHGPSFQHTILYRNTAGQAYKCNVGQGFVNAPFAFGDGAIVGPAAVNTSFNRPGQGTNWIIGFYDCPRFYGLNLGQYTNVEHAGYTSTAYAATGAHVLRRYGFIAMEGVGVTGYQTARTTVAAGSTGVNVNTFAGAGTLNVVATDTTDATGVAFATSGTLTVTTSAGVATITYTGTTGTTFTGCTTTSGSGTLTTGNAVSSEGVVDEFTGLLIGNMQEDGTTILPLRQATSNFAAKIAGQILAYPSDTTFTATPAQFIRFQNTYTLNFANATFGQAFSFAPTIVLQQSSAAAGMGSLFNNTAIVKNDAAVAAGMSNLVTVVAQPTIQADTQTITQSSQVDFQSTTKFGIVNGGTLTTTIWRQFYASSATSIGTGATVTTRVGFAVADITGAGTLTNNYGIDIAALSKGATLNVGIRNASALRQVAASTFGADAAARTGSIVDVQGGALAYSNQTGTTLTYASPTSVDPTLGNVFKVTTVNATGSVTFNLASTPPFGQVLHFIIVNDGTSGKTITFGTGFKSTGTLAGTTSQTRTITFISDGTNAIEVARTAAMA